MSYHIFLQVPDSIKGDLSYRIGYHFGAWLPFLILALVAFIVIRAGQRRR